MSEHDLLTSVLRAAELNSLLAGRDLLDAAGAVAELATQHDLAVMGVGDAGERIIGAALGLRNLRTVDQTRRVDNLAVLVVSGYTAGAYDIATAAIALHSMGASTVHAVVLGSLPAGDIAGCDSVTRLDRGIKLLLVA